MKHYRKREVNLFIAHIVLLSVYEKSLEKPPKSMRKRLRNDPWDGGKSFLVRGLVALPYLK